MMTAAAFVALALLLPGLTCAQVLPNATYVFLLHADHHGRCELNATLMNVYTKERCEEAAAALGLLDTSVPDHVNYDAITGRPPYGCYYRNNYGARGSLYFNNDTRDLGNDDCGSYCDSICAFREGCTDPSYTEYDPFAVDEDGSCRVPVDVLHGDDGVCPPLSAFYLAGNATTGASTTTTVRTPALCPSHGANHSLAQGVPIVLRMHVLYGKVPPPPPCSSVTLAHTLTTQPEWPRL